MDKLTDRLVARKLSQEEGVDFAETFSPIFKPSTIRLIFTIATVSMWKIHQLDVKNAFYNALLQDTVYVYQSPGLEHEKYPSYVCKLNKALYGLKQAPSARYDRISSSILSHGFFSNSGDPSMFIKHSDQHILILLLYLDDMLITGSFQIIYLIYCILLNMNLPCLTQALCTT